MRFLFKRQPADELQPEIQDVRQAMCSGGLVLFDLIFYSLIFAILIMPVKAGLMLFCGLFLSVYISFAFIFLIVRKALNNRGTINFFRR